jgi:hypothetical protein
MFPYFPIPPLHVNLKGLPNKRLTFENRSYLGKLEAGIKKAFSRESGPEGVLFDEKKNQQSRDIVSLIGM